MSDVKKQRYMGGTAKLLTSQKVNSIVRIIENWETKLTWDLLVARIKSELGFSITRQGLNSYAPVAEAFRQQKQRLKMRKLGFAETAIPDTSKEMQSTYLDKACGAKNSCIRCMEMEAQVKRLKEQKQDDELIKEKQLEYIQRLYDNIVRHYPGVVDLELIAQPFEKPSYE